MLTKDWENVSVGEKRVGVGGASPATVHTTPNHNLWPDLPVIASTSSTATVNHPPDWFWRTGLRARPQRTSARDSELIRRARARRPRFVSPAAKRVAAINHLQSLRRLAASSQLTLVINQRRVMSFIIRTSFITCASCLSLLLDFCLWI